MSELATMAALKITNSINQHYQQQNQEPLTPIQSYLPNMPFTAQSPQSDESWSTVTTTNNNLTATTNTNTNNTNTTNSMTTNPESPDVSSTATDDTLSRQASVDAAPYSNDYDDIAIYDTNQTLSSSTSGINLLTYLMFFLQFVFTFVPSLSPSIFFFGERELKRERGFIFIDF